MKKKRLKKLSYLMMTFLTAATMLTGALGNEKNVMASPTPGTIQEALPNKTSARTITIHKYKVPSFEDLMDRDTGEILSDKVVGKTPYEGVVFRVARVQPKNNLVNLVSWEENQNDWEYYDGGGDRSLEYDLTGTTDANGEVTFRIAAEGYGYYDPSKMDGTYLVREVSVPVQNDRGEIETKPGALTPFFVQLPQTDRSTHQGLIYDVNVYPKNVVYDDLNISKTVNGKTIATSSKGSSVTWESTVDVSKGLLYTPKTDLTVQDFSQTDKWVTLPANQPVVATTFEIVDQLDKRLSLIKNKSKVEYTKDGTTWTDAPTADYTMNEVDNEVTVVFNEVAKKKLATEGYKKVRAVLATTFYIPDDSSKEGFENYFYNQSSVNLMTLGLPLETKNSNLAFLVMGSVKIDKSDEANTSIKLKGAEFKFALSQKDAEDGKFLKNDKGEDIKAITDDDGFAYANGLPFDVDKAKVDTSGLSPRGGCTYYVVETKAPRGYELSKDVKEKYFMIQHESEGAYLLPLEVTNKRTTLLPFTGAGGVGPIVALAMVIMLIGVGAVILERRMRSAE